MRLSLIGLAAAVAVSAFSFGAAPAKATELPKIDLAGTQNPAAEPVRYRRWGYGPYRYWGPRYPRTYRYTRPYNYYYGAPYARYYGPYGYWRSPYYGRRYYY